MRSGNLTVSGMPTRRRNARAAARAAARRRARARTPHAAQTWGFQRDSGLPNPSAAIAMTPSAESADPAVSRFLDAVWMERGLSPNTLAAYRADLTALARWLAGRSVPIMHTSR